METASLVVLGLMALVTTLLFVWTRVILQRQVQREALENYQAFGRAVELRFPAYAGDTRRILDLTERLGQVAGLTPRERRRLAIAARLRDIGLCTIPYSLLNEKPEILWNPEERETFYAHPFHGANMVEQLPLLADAATAIRWHHQPFDPDQTGEGPLGTPPAPAAPDGPRGKDLPVEARILALVTEIAFAERFEGAAGVRQRLESGRGRQFDPDLCDLLRPMLDSERGERIARVP